MKWLSLLFIVFNTLTLNTQDSLIGVWNIGQDNTKVEITNHNGIYEGRIISSDNTKAKAGGLILKEVKSVNGKWQGKLYSPKKKEWFDAVLKVEGKKMLVTVKSGVASKTVEWIKA